MWNQQVCVKTARTSSSRIDPICLIHKSIYFRTRRIAMVSQQAQGRSCLSFTDDLSLKEKKRDIRSHGEHIWGQSTEDIPLWLCIFHLSSYESSFHNTCAGNTQQQEAMCSQQVRAIDYATLSYTQTEKPVSIQDRNEEKNHKFFLRKPCYSSSSRFQIHNCTNFKCHVF